MKGVLDDGFEETGEYQSLYTQTKTRTKTNLLERRLSEVQNASTFPFQTSKHIALTLTHQLSNKLPPSINPESLNLETKPGTEKLQPLTGPLEIIEFGTVAPSVDLRT